MSKCRSCGADIFWVKTLRGKSMPIDYDKDLAEEFERAAMYKHTVDFDPARMRSHFSTCPEADQHRKPQEREEQLFYEPKTNNDDRD